MIKADCALCLKPNVDLLDSHYIPKGLYKVLRNPHLKNPNPVRVSQSRAVLTTEQTSDYLLCAECEKRFNLNGEKWVISKVWRDRTNFPLRKALLDAGAKHSDPDFHFFEGAKIAAVKTDKLAYFAASVFWRGAVHKWTIQGEKHDTLEMGPYQEQLRLYLMGGTWPKNVVLHVYVGNGWEEFRNNITVFPYLRYLKGFRQFAFVVPGITFFLFTGKAIPPSLRDFCIAQSPLRWLMMAEEVDKGNAQRNIKLFKTAVKTGALARRLAQPGNAAPSPWPASEMLALLTPRRKQ